MVVQCVSCKAISEDLNGVKKKLDSLDTHVNQIVKFSLKVMHSLATTLCLQHQDKEN